MNLYELSLNHKNPYRSHGVDSIKPIKTNRRRKNNQIIPVLKQLSAKGYIKREPFDEWSMTDEGIKYVINHPMRKEETDVSSS